MIRISLPTIIELDLEKNQALTDDTERRKFALDDSSFRIDSTRLGDIRIEITVENSPKPEGLFIYYFQQYTKSQLQPIDLPFSGGNKRIIEIKESDFWRNNPLYVDRIGILGRGRGTCKLQVEVFKRF